MTETPNSLPLLDQGKHESAEQGACLQEYVSVLAGESFSDRPSCVDDLLSEFGRRTNDGYDNPRQRTEELAPLIPRFIGTAVADRYERARMHLRFLDHVMENSHRYFAAWAAVTGRGEEILRQARAGAANAHAVFQNEGGVPDVLAYVWSALAYVEPTVELLTNFLDIAEEFVGKETEQLTEDQARMLNILKASEYVRGRYGHVDG